MIAKIVSFDVLIPSADCINDHLEIGLLQALDVKGFNSLSKAAKKELGSPDDPYYLAFARELMEIVDYVHEDDRISLICGDDPETAWDCYRHYRGVRQAHAEIRRRTVALSFSDDKHFPGLQAADMVAFISRLDFVERLGRGYLPVSDGIRLASSTAANASMRGGVGSPPLEPGKRTADFTRTCSTCSRERSLRTERTKAATPAAIADENDVPLSDRFTTPSGSSEVIPDPGADSRTHGPRNCKCCSAGLKTLSLRPARPGANGPI